VIVKKLALLAAVQPQPFVDVVTAIVPVPPSAPTDALVGEME
jgi:hypothetical protein